MYQQWPPTPLPPNNLLQTETSSSPGSSTQQGTTSSATFSQGGALWLFLQAVGITFEDGVIAIASRLGYGGKKIMASLWLRMVHVFHADMVRPAGARWYLR